MSFNVLNTLLARKSKSQIFAKNSALESIQSLATRYASHSMKSALKRNFKVRLEKSEILPNGKPTMLYIHIPFCHTFCPYCSFHKYLYDENLARAYFHALRSEIQIIKSKGFDFTTVVVGGGTTLINEGELLATLELCKRLFSIRQISCESDPTHIKPAQLKRFSGLITRLSCGVQSFDDSILRKIGRYEKFGSSAELQERLAKAQGILPILSIDLIFNFPNQSREQLLSDLRIAKSIGTEQITTYPLMRSNLTESKIATALGVNASDNERAFYELICAEFRQYKRNNAWGFAKKTGGCSNDSSGAESVQRENLISPKSTLNDEYVSSHHQYLGAGSGAFSFINGRLFINAFNLQDYCDGILQEGNANMANAEFSRRDILRYVFLCELFSGGLSVNEFNANMECDLERELALELAGLRACGAIRTHAGENLDSKKRATRIECSEFGRYICVVLMKEFYAGMDLVRATFRDESKLGLAQKEKLQKGIIEIMRYAKPT